MCPKEAINSNLFGFNAFHAKFMDMYMELQTQKYIDTFLDCAYNTYNENKFTGNVTEREKQDITQLLFILVSVPNELNKVFCDFMFQRAELPIVVSFILFVSMNNIKKFDINQKYSILKNETKYSCKSLNMLKTICAVYDIGLEEKQNIFRKTKIKLVFPLGFKERVLQEQKYLPAKGNKLNSTLSSDYDNFVKWWADCRESEISNNETLFGAYQIMCFYNEICNGGFDQFWDFAENSNWDIEQMKKTFKKLLPSTFYALFEKALYAHNNGKDCEEYNNEFEYDKMQDEILPELASRVMKILN
ncbi:MAG: DMP19 family protein [Clostridiales bacterium]|nr:DMP19 family protein [Clostridiales bacterium]